MAHPSKKFNPTAVLANKQAAARGAAKKAVIAKLDRAKVALARVGKAKTLGMRVVKHLH